MKSLIKSILLYDTLYPLWKKSILYHAYKEGYAQLANVISGFPSKDFFVIGVTGTDGKTTTTNLIHKILNDHIGKTMMVSTANIKIGSQEIFNDKKMTSLDAFDLQSLFVTAKENGCKYAVLEVSSHSLDQRRFAGVEFDMGVLTNITPEHLDYHGSFEAYAEAKKMLFTSVLRNTKKTTYAVLPKDDEYGRKWFEELAFDKAVNFGIKSSAILKAEHIEESKHNTIFTFSYLGKNFGLTTNLLGAYNVYNLLAAIGVGILLGVDMQKIIDSLQQIESINGRMNSLCINEVNYFVDFAHTPNALESSLSYICNIKQQARLICVFGAPGNRDRYKRPLMGAIADKYADIIIVTDDDAGTENRLAIINEICEPIKRQQGHNFFIIPEREFALKFCVDIAQPGDYVIFAGKGHEQVLLTNFGKRPRNDKQALISYCESITSPSVSSSGSQ